MGKTRHEGKCFQKGNGSILPIAPCRRCRWRYFQGIPKEELAALRGDGGAGEALVNPRETTEIPVGPFPVIYMDPPWMYKKPAFRKKGKPQGEANIKYPTMTIEELVAMRPMVDSWAGTDCALFMWATAPRLDMALELGKSWGWRYVTMPWVWLKAKSTVAARELFLPLQKLGIEVRIEKGFLVVGLETSVAELFLSFIMLGMGFHTSIQCEYVLLFKRGAPGTFGRRMLPQVIISPRREHSRKPDEVRTGIETAYPGRRRLEVFARETVDGWECFGNETGKFGHVPRALALCDQIDEQDFLIEPEKEETNGQDP